MFPRLMERTGPGEEGTITAFYTVLVEGDDMNEPITDAVRGILDGHIVLSRALATANHFPAIDVLESISRLGTEVGERELLDAAGTARDLLAVYRRNEDLINIGAYARGTDPRIDAAIAKRESIGKFLRQRVDERISREEAIRQLIAAL